MKELKTFEYVEDWLDLLNSGYSNGVGVGQVSSKGTVRLAPYDEKFVAGICSIGLALTDRQLHTARKIIKRYKKQLLKLGYDNSQVDNLPTRRPLRDVDRSFLVWYEDGFYYLQFPYQSKLNALLYDMRQKSIGQFNWNKHKKHWEIEAHEIHLSMLVKFMSDAVNQHDWVFCPVVKEHFDLAAAVYYEPNRYLPTIELVNQKLQLLNGNSSLLAAMQKSGFAEDADPLYWCWVSNLFALRIGNQLNKYVQDKQPLVAHKITISQDVLDNTKKVFDHGISKKEFVALLELFNNLKWIICTSQRSKIVNELELVAKEPEFKSKIKVMTSDVYKKYIETTKDNLSDTVLINCTGVRQLYAPPLHNCFLKTFYYFGE